MEKTHEIAVQANLAAFDLGKGAEIARMAGHLNHPTLRNLYGEILADVYNFSAEYTAIPRVLDLGAGEGVATLPFLQLGARVTAVDISKSQLKTLQTKCTDYTNKLDVYCGDAFEAIQSLQSQGERYDIIAAISFLHHIPDYLDLIRQATTVLSDRGQFFSFQDPLRYDSVGKATRAFSLLAFFSWRIFQGDVIGGIRRFIRRSKGVYLEDCPEDNYEYHVVRNGVDQDAIYNLLIQQGLECKIVRYFSTISPVWQPLGSALGVRSNFAITARRT